MELTKFLQAMKCSTFLLFFMMSIFLVSCEGEQQAFSIDRCVGEYVCTVNGYTFMVLPGGMTDSPDLPSSNYPKKGNVITVTKTSENELTLTLEDRVMVARVDETGKMTIPETIICIENKISTMTLTAQYPTAYITHDMIFIKQEATGTAFCNDKGNKYTLTVTNTQYFDGKK